MDKDDALKLVAGVAAVGFFIFAGPIAIATAPVLAGAAAAVPVIGQALASQCTTEHVKYICERSLDGLKLLA